ncbi:MULTISPECIES: double-cubane-cluster-containing anaerobic reductase [unclassified Paludibacterium]|uniref:double-cubane-cluster-containing anaerobic reductase n=1 Tax=unclassified Paludibacterium TaxID=2618429 RepID=UPI001C040548|nr:double-cubane-cluster-containing anaerobic reductase [Paludibacterium sp. B53371]BEV72490.1 double-cubane-cluster-containing anaerobic reductase [Paludibacterium sp. THUN1379]
MSEYREMWQSLGLDLDAHDALLSYLGQVYQDVFISQPNRPQGMQYFDFVMSEVHGLRIKELMDAKAAGRKIIGSYCTYVPEELILALDGVSVGLCTGGEWATELVDQILPRNTCALIKSAFGFKLGKVCPYVEACDLVVGENTCDGKKKAYEILGDYIPDLYVIDLPQVKSAAGKQLMLSEYAQFARKLEAVTGKTLQADKLAAAIVTVNNKRRALKRLAALRTARPVPISGLDALLISQVSFYDDPVRFTNSVNQLCDELEQRVQQGVGVFPADHPRVVLSGCPMAVPNWKIPAIVESSGAVIVAEEGCVGERSTRWLTDESGSTLPQMMQHLVDRYLQIDCAVFTPNPSRLNFVRDVSAERKSDGVIHYTLQFCQPYQMETGPVIKALEQSAIPTLRIDTDYSQEDVGQIRTRVEAFIERLSA